MRVGAFTSFYRHHIARSIGLVFAATGLLYGTWSALIPFVKEKFGLDEAQLGLLLLSLPAGVTFMNPFAVPILHRFGAPKTALFSLALASVLFVAPLTATSVWLLAVSLFFAGAAFSTTNVAMNTCSTMLEGQQQIRIMSTCHGLWSAGAMSGSALASVFTGLGILPLLYSSIVAGLLVSVALLLRRPLQFLREIRQDGDETAPVGKKFTFPNALLWSLIVISLCTNLAEGTMADWSAVYMKEVLASPPYMIGWGFASYAFFMAGGRFVGDGLLVRYGERVVLMGGGIVAAIGLLLPVIFQNTGVALLGFAMVGAGVSLGAPVLYGASSRVPGMAPGAGLATMNTFAMAGFLGGPALIGFIAKYWSLPAAFALVSCAALFWAWRARQTVAIK